MLKTRWLSTFVFALVGAAIGSTLGIAGSALGFFFGAVGGTFVFAAIGAIIGWFAARDINDKVTALNTSHPKIRSKTTRLLASFAHLLYLAFGLILLLISAIMRKLIELFWK